MNIKKKQIKILIYLMLLIFCFSFAFKIIGLKQNEVFIDTDEVNFLQAAMDMFHVFDAPFDFDNIIFRFFRFWIYQYSPMYILLNFVWISFLSIFQIPLNEFTFTLLNVLIGSVTSIGVFLIGREIHSRKAGLTSAIFFIVIPLSAGFRHTTSPVQPAILFLIFSFYFLIKYFKNPTKKMALISSIFIAGYLISDNQFLGIFPLILSIGFIYSYQIKKTHITAIFHAIKKILTPYLCIIPFFVSSPIIVVWLYYGIKNNYWTASLFGHTFSRTLEVGFNLNGIHGIVLSVGLLYSVCLVITYFYGFGKAIQLKKEGLFFIWGTIYLFPWIFTLIRTDLGQRLYYLQGITPLIILSSILFLNTKNYFHNQILNKAGRLLINFCLYGLAIIILIFTLSTTLDFVYEERMGITPLKATGLFNDQCLGVFKEEDKMPICDSPRYCYTGSNYKKNWGSKTAGYYIRKITNPNEVVYTEIGTPAARHYFGRPVFNNMNLWMVGQGNLDLKFNDLPHFFANISTVVVRSCNYDKVKQYINDSFHKVAEVHSEGKPVLYIFSKQKKELIIMDTEKYDALFDKEFGNWKSLYLEDWLYYEGIGFNQSFKTHFE